MKRYGLIGYPLGHSFSKNYFTKKFQEEGITGCVYETFPIPSISELPGLLAANPDLCGFNVTIPYKEQVIPFLTEKSAVVQKTGACNCVRVHEGKLMGYNTDVIGFEESLVKAFPDLPSQALVLGTGGAAKAVCYVLQKRDIRYLSVSRREGPGVIRYEDLTGQIIGSHQLIINTTPLGMAPKVEEAPAIPYEYLTAAHCLFDLVYNPDRTLFLQRGSAHGARTCNGLEMLVIQAEESWKIWNS